MGLYNNAKCKLCRRAGEKLFLRGDRCYGPKCAIVKRNYPPGAHGPKGSQRMTSFGLQLKEKQKAKRTYGLREAQLKNFYLKAKKIKGNTAEVFLKFLELRLDNVVYRLGLAKSRNQARQIVSHRHITINGKINNRPSAQVKSGAIIGLRPASANKAIFKNLAEGLQKYETPNWLKLDAKNFSGEVITSPTAEDVKPNFDVRAIIEFYSR